jgi:drug/metabolite transporter (DMT)-like permease
MASVAAAVVGVQVGATIVATRFVIEQTHPVSLALLRYAIGAFCLLPPLLVSTRVAFSRRDLLPLSLLGITQFGIVVVLLNYAVQFVPAARAALIFATFPLQAMLIAALLGYEPLSPNRSLGVLLTIVGVGVALGEDAMTAGASRSWLGELLIGTSAFAGASCSVLYRPYLQKYPTLQVSIFAMVASVVFLTFVAAPAGLLTAAPRFTADGWLALLFIGVSTSGGYFLWLWALKNTTPTRVTIFMALNPIAAAGLGILLLGEQPRPGLLVGIGCVACGLAVAHRGPLPLPEPSAAGRGKG